MQFLSSIIDEPVNEDDLLAINSRLLQLAHQRRNIPNLVIQTRLPAVLRTQRRKRRAPRQRRPNTKRIAKQPLPRALLTPRHNPLLHAAPQPSPPSHEAVKPRMIPVPRAALEQQTILPALLVNVQTHVHVPALPVPCPARVRYLRVCNVDGGRLELGVEPGRGVDAQVPEGFGGEERDAEDEPAALVFVEYVNVGGGCGGWGSWFGACGWCGVAGGVVDEVDLRVGHVVGWSVCVWVKGGNVGVAPMLSWKHGGIG